MLSTGRRAAHRIGLGAHRIIIYGVRPAPSNDAGARRTVRLACFQQLANLRARNEYRDVSGLGSSLEGRRYCAGDAARPDFRGQSVRWARPPIAPIAPGSGSARIASRGCARRKRLVSVPIGLTATDTVDDPRQDDHEAPAPSKRSLHTAEVLQSPMLLYSRLIVQC